MHPSDEISVRIDAHQHFWEPRRGDYDWMPDGDPVLGRRYCPADLLPQLKANGITGTVLVQAAPSIYETEYLLGLIDATPWILGVVGWIDFAKPSDLHQLRRLATHPGFKGVRPMIESIPDKDWVLRDDIQWAFRALCDLGLRLDVLGDPQHLENVNALLKRYPAMPVVLDHCMKPRTARSSPAQFRVWAEGMSRIAEETTATVKLSGLVAQPGRNWRVDHLAPCADHVFSAFGAARVMWGSDWPVCRRHAEYGDWYRAARELAARRPDIDQARVFGGTAIEFYGLAPG